MVEPKYKNRSGKVQGAVWANKKEGKNGEFETYSATIVKSYKDGDDYKETTSFFENELADLIVVATDCQRYIKLEAKKKE